MKVQANIPCCICGAGASEPLFETEYPVFNYPGTFSMRKCSGCGLLFNSPRLPDADFPSLYQDNYYFFKRDDAVEFARIVQMYRRTVKLVESDIKDKKVVEIGSAKGYLLAVMHRMGWHTKGIEISKAAAEYAHRKFGIDTYVGTLEQYLKSQDFAKSPFVLAIDLIEHVLSPLDFIRSVNQIMEDNAVLIIDTPNGGSHNQSTEGVRWKGCNPFHIFLFSKDNITQLLSDNGFSVEQVFSYGNQPAGAKEKPPQKSSKKGLKNLIKSALKRLHLFSFCMLISKIPEQLVDILPKNHVKRAVKTIKVSPPYFRTADSTGPLANDCRGDNLVVIAKKVGSPSLKG